MSATAYILEQNNKLEGGEFLGRQNFKSHEKSKFFLKNVGFDQKVERVKRIDECIIYSFLF